MKSLQWLILALYLSACQAQTTRTITILDEGKVVSVSTSTQIPSSILAEAGIAAQPTDRILVNGIPYALSDKITDNGHIQLQLLHAVNIILISPQGEQKIQTSAFTVGDVLKEAGIKIGIHDRVTPPPSTPVTESLTIEFSPARELIITSGGMSLTIHSAAKTIGEALAEAGIPLQGLDASFPAENEALPADGQIRVVRVSESISVEIQSIPFSTEEAESADVAFGQQEILQNGVNGLAMTRTRIRYEDGVEVSRMDEGRTVLKDPIPQQVLNGTKIVLSPVGGDAPYQYWYATQMYASWYSPCNSGTGGCSYGTASGARAGYGIVAVDYSIYSYLAGMKVYIPGYGLATIGDTGGGPIVETNYGVPRTQWIDLGYDDNAIGGLSGWVTVYFLAPAPTEIPYFFQ